MCLLSARVANLYSLLTDELELERCFMTLDVVLATFDNEVDEACLATFEVIELMASETLSRARRPMMIDVMESEEGWKVRRMNNGRKDER